MTAFQLPDLDYAQSPHTGWTRDHHAAVADHMLLGARTWASPGHARIVPPGPVGGYGRDIDGLEGFARTFLAAGFRLAGEPGNDPNNLAEWYAAGIASGTDPHSPERWVRPDEHDQAKVEAAALAVILDLTRPWIWDALTAQVQEQVVDYFSLVIHARYPDCNWVWFRIVVEQFLKSVGAPYSRADMDADLAMHDSFVRAGGWYSDGPERAFDHYTGWALHLYPVLWQRMAGDDGLAAARWEQDKAHLDRYLLDAVRLVGADGSPLIQGRSLIYRFAAAAPFWAGAAAGCTSVAPGLLRRAASGIVSHFAARGVPGADGGLSMGWHGPWPALAQSYSGPGSPYWASKGLYGLALPADHEVWTAVEEPLPVELEDFAFRAEAPHWLVSGTKADGVVRVVNHGTDHAAPGDAVTDSPTYARLAYSTVTAPLMDAEAEANPFDASVTLTDPEGRPSHRAGFEALDVETRTDGGAPLPAAGSRWRTHWVSPDPNLRDHGSGKTGTTRFGAPLTVLSTLNGPWEVRLARMDRAAEPHEVPPGILTLGGWPQPSPEVPGPTAAVVPLRGFSDSGTEKFADATPLAGSTMVAWVATAHPPEPGYWHAAAVHLGSQLQDAVPELHLRDLSGEPQTAVITWPDGRTTYLRLPETPAAQHLYKGEPQ